MLGGGLIPGTNALLIGPSGVGKTSTIVCCLLAALRRGERCIYYLFDETLGTLLIRAKALGMDMSPYLRQRAADVAAGRSRRNVAGRVHERCTRSR